MGRRIVVVGSSNTDMILQLERVPRPGETLLGGDFTMAAGGKGANQAVAAARAAGDVSFVARVGKDIFGDLAIKGFHQDNINLDHLTVDDTLASGTALIFVAQNGENCIGVASGANGRLSPTDVERAREQIARADILLLQLETPLETVAAAIHIAKEHGVRVILNPAPAQHLPREILANVSILTPNEHEAKLLTGITIENDESALQAAQALLLQGVETVIMTLGSRGALIASSTVTAMIPGFQVKAVDTTAAGDTFNGALAVALAEGMSLINAVEFANAAAAISVTALGAQPSTPTRAAIDDFLHRRLAGTERKST